MATTGDRYLATSGDFFMATDTSEWFTQGYGLSTSKRNPTWLEGTPYEDRA